VNNSTGSTNSNQYIVFYSWQSWLPSRVNRNFIEDALEIAVKNVNSSGGTDAVQIEEREEQEEVVELDKDTAGVPGSPDIARTILEKIDRSAIVVCDVSLVNQREGDRADNMGRATPNPNVLVELGYALKALGEQRVIMVMNTAFGGPEQLPFDLKMKRVVPYTLPVDASDKAAVKRELANRLAATIKSIIGHLSTERSVATAAATLSPTSNSDVSAFINRMLRSLEESVSVPASEQGMEPDELLLRAIGRTEGAVASFARFIEEAVTHNATPAIHQFHRAFERILGYYYLPQKLPHEVDFYRFMGHELFVVFTHNLIQGERWDLLADLLNEQFYVERDRDGKPAMHSYERLSDYLKLMYERNRRLQKTQVSMHSDTLRDRYMKGSLGQIVPFRQFMEADYCLYLRSAFQTPELRIADQWTPWSNLYIRDNPPQYLVRAQQRRYAEQLLKPLGLESLVQLRALLKERGPKVEQHFDKSDCIISPLGQIDLDNIGTR